MESAAALRAAADRLVSRVKPWGPPRWAQPVQAEIPGTAASPAGPSLSPGSGALTRADVVFGLVQRLADIAADAEERPRRPVPRPDNDLALPDQLRVMVSDLLRLGPAAAGAVRSAAAAVDAVRRAL